MTKTEEWPRILQTLRDGYRISPLGPDRSGARLRPLPRAPHFDGLMR
jgi:hypothetical protein